MIEKINDRLIQPISPPQKIKNEDDEEKRREDRMQRAKDALEKKRELKDKDNKKNRIDIVA